MPPKILTDAQVLDLERRNALYIPRTMYRKADPFRTGKIHVTAVTVAGYVYRRDDPTATWLLLPAEVLQ